MSVLISGYYSSADPRKLDKSGNLQTIFGGIEAKLKDDCDLMNPTFVLYTNNDYVRINYLYCSTWGKYYFVNDISFSAGRTMELHCSVDVLMTYRAAIRDLNVNVYRQEFLKNKNLVDSEYVTGVQMNTENHYFNDDPFNADLNADRCYMLTVVGGVDNIDYTYEYVVLQSEPADWATNWGNYYVKAGVIVEINPYITVIPKDFDYFVQAYGAVYERIVVPKSE